MGTTITIFEAIVISVVAIVLYAFVKSLIEHFKSN